MLRKVKIKDSVILFIGILLIISGILVLSSEYLKSKKNKAFSDMNLKLYENEQPKNIKDDEEIKNNDNSDLNNDENPPKDNSIKTEPTYNYKGILEIPKINVKRGFLDVKSKYNNVDYNVTVINGSTMPDEDNNNLILASHSGYCSVCSFHDFSKIELNDIAILYYQGYKHTHKVVNIYEVLKTGQVSTYRNHNKNTLTLITCTRNSDTKQTVYILELDKKEKN